MEQSFWESRWESKNIGFHQEQTNTQLRNYWSALALPAGSRVFVPLAGKSLDIVWLMQRHEVLANELSATAVEAFFNENKIEHSVAAVGELQRHTAPGLEFYQGDYFALPDDELAACRAVFDRASLVALPTQMRERYAAKLCDALEPGAKIMLITIEYDQRAFDGPPFAISSDEVERLFGGAFRIQALGKEDEEFRGINVRNGAYCLTRL
ncbi:thiopurine S-methyltransferase [Halioglobus maricola]|uniref:Thiopurine S-methyltransferase n=1 Tax=Halioglobus maricola TaxID=2601894 RepID=A0A5P9NKB2_9GAMM|nr:thiopurine S-methyltransferase [Halioglobus maricola]QFU75955.1 thiopurine S-methyltransferase [Halioglobus maricola]